MMQQTPFHSRVEQACETNDWYCWKGYTTPNSYTDVELEYFSIRNACGVFDLCPMIKYRITGKDAQAYLNRLVTRDVSKIRIGRVGYTVWCDDAGQVLDDGTLFHLGENDYRLCSYSHVLDWLSWSALGFDVSIVDETAEVAALSLQGPTSCSALRAMGLEGIGELKPFGLMDFTFEGVPLMVSRTGFTGDLGYELWIAVCTSRRRRSGIKPLRRRCKPLPDQALCGCRSLLELARIEAGFLQAGVDFVPSAETAVRSGRARSSPFELGLDWLVDLDKPVFNGRKALLPEQTEGSRKRIAMLDVEGNKPAVHSFVYAGKKQVGTVTSAAWCPTIKSNFAIASVDAAYSAPALNWSRKFTIKENCTGPG